MPDHIRALRLRHKLRQRDVALQIGSTNYQIRKWERGLELPPPSSVRTLADLFGVAPSALEHAQKSFMQSAAPGEGYTTAQAPYSKVEQSTAPVSLDKLRVLDLFCGAGGLSFGLELTGCFRTVAGLDLLPDRIATFRANHPHATGIVGDIRDISARSLDGHCQQCGRYCRWTSLPRILVHTALSTSDRGRQTQHPH